MTSAATSRKFEDMVKSAEPAAVLGLVLGLAASVLFLSFQPSGLVEAGKTAPLAPPQAAIAASASR